MWKIALYGFTGYKLGKVICEKNCRIEKDEIAREAYEKGYQTAMLKCELSEYLNEAGELQMKTDVSSKVIAEEIWSQIKNVD